MTAATYDVVAIGNAIVDIIAKADDDFIAANGMTKGAMQLVFSPEEADALYAKMGPGTEVSGGSAANTIAGMAALGSACGFVGQVADDQLGNVFAHDIRAAGIRFDTAARAGSPTTGRCLIFVSPDGQRTMNTFLGASHFLPAEALDRALIEGAATSTWRVTCGIRRSRARRCGQRSTSRGRRDARSPSRCRRSS